MGRFRKKPVEVEAIRFTENNMGGKALLRFLDGYDWRLVDDGEAMVIPTLEGEMRAGLGDWIIKGVAEEIYPCKHEIFMATYERVGPEVDQ